MRASLMIRLYTMSEKWVSDTKIFVSVRTLKYMVRGGRVSHFKGFIATSAEY